MVFDLLRSHWLMEQWHSKQLEEQAAELEVLMVRKEAWEEQQAADMNKAAGALNKGQKVGKPEAGRGNQKGNGEVKPVQNGHGTRKPASGEHAGGEKSPQCKTGSSVASVVLDLPRESPRLETSPPVQQVCPWPSPRTIC